MNHSYPPVRLAIVGCGLIARNSHLPAALRSPRVDLVALVDTDVERARTLARMFECDVKTVGQVEDILASVDGVLVATPNHTHASVAETVLNAGLPVLIEKPLTTDYAAAVHLCELADRKKTFISTGYKTRHHPSVQLMKELLDSRFFGKVHSFQYEFGSRGGWAPLSSYNLDRRQAGGGVLVVTGTHFLDRMLYWFGDPEIIGFKDDSFGGPEANCQVIVRYPNEAGAFEGVIQLSKTVPLRNKFTMETEYYRCELAEDVTEEILVTPKSRPELEMKLGYKSVTRPSVDYFQTQIEEFATCIRTGKAPLVDGWFGARSVKLLEGLYANRSQLPEPWMWYHNLEQKIYA